MGTLLSLLLLAGCSSDPAPAAGPVAPSLPPAVPGFQPSTTPYSDTPWGQELANLNPDGTRTKASALRLFAIAFGAIPGQEAIDNKEPIRSATAAIRAVQGHWTELTSEQQVAIEDRLAAPSDALVIHVDPQGMPSTPSASDSLAPQALVPKDQATLDLEAALRIAVTDVRAQIAAKIGSDIPGPIDVSLAGAVPEKYGFANFNYYGLGGTYSGCHVHITDLAIASGAPYILDTLAHEIFHCFEANGYRTMAARVAAPMWVLEGGAEWVGNDLPGPLTPTDLWWDDYLTQPSISLQVRSYAAVGFWAHLAESGKSPWDVFPAVFMTTSGEAAFRATGAPENDAFLDSWASSTTRKAERGPAWDTNSPGITTSAAPLKKQEVAIGDTLNFETAAYAVGLYDLSISAQVLTVRASGHARISDGKIDTTAFPASFCVKDDGCSPCPNAGGSQLPPAPLAPDAILAVTGGVDGTTGTIIGMSIDDYCKEKDSKSVWAHLDRPASPGLMAGTVIELAACHGKIGPWAGVMRLGGIDSGDGFVVPFAELPMAFTITAEDVPANAKVNGTVTTPVFDVDVAYDLQITVHGDTMSITGTGSADNGMFTLSDVLLGNNTLPIEPAPAGECGP